MTAVTRWNKSKSPAGTDGWNLTTDVGTAMDSVNAVVPVADQTERDGLAPPAGKYPGMTVIREDIPGYPLEVYTGSGWQRQISPIMRANTQTVGSGMSADAFVSGALQPMIQAGTFVGTTTGGGDLTITYPAAFPHGVIGGIGFSGDGIYIVSATPTSVALPTTSSLFLRFANPNGSVAASVQVRGTWIAVGW